MRIAQTSNINIIMRQLYLQARYRAGVGALSRTACVLALCKQAALVVSNGCARSMKLWCVLAGFRQPVGRCVAKAKVPASSSTTSSVENLKNRNAELREAIDSAVAGGDPQQLKAVLQASACPCLSQSFPGT